MVMQHSGWGSGYCQLQALKLVLVNSWREMVCAIWKKRRLHHVGMVRGKEPHHLQLLRLVEIAVVGYFSALAEAGWCRVVVLVELKCRNTTVVEISVTFILVVVNNNARCDVVPLTRNV